MKKHLQSGWMRVLSCIICAISIVSLAVGVAGFVYVTALRHEESVYQTGYREVAENYAIYAMDMLENGQEEELQKSFTEKGISCSIQLVLNIPGENEEIISTVEKQVNIGEIDEETMYELEAVAGADYRYRETSLLGVLIGYAYYSDGTGWVDYPKETVVFDPLSGMFCYKTAAGFYAVEEIQVYDRNDAGYYDYKLNKENGTFYYYNGYYNKRLDPAKYLNWEWVEIDGSHMELASKGEWRDEIEVLEAGALQLEEIQTDEYHSWGDMISAPEQGPFDMYQVQISWKEEPHVHSLFSEWKALSNALDMFDTVAVPLIIGSFILMAISFGFVIYSANGKKEQLGFMAKLPVVCYTLVIYTVTFCIAALAWEIGLWLIQSDLGRLSDIIMLAGLIAFVLAWLVLSWLQNIVTRFKCKSFWRTSEVYYGYKLIKFGWGYITKPIKWFWKKITSPFQKMFESINTNTNLFSQGMTVLVGLAVIEFIFIVTFGYTTMVYLYAFIITKPIEIMFIMYILFQMQQLEEAGKRVAAGDISNPIDTKKLIWKFKEHGENINKVSVGIQLAVNERMKSEHFKTELITNVSHDIKTPLTSIINYVDLIKKEEIQDEKVQGYVEVLDRQSARLKKLIEDLMEASKASTGNLAVNLEECDVEVLLTQVIGEFEERLQKNQLEILVSKPDHPVKMMADGRHMWRVLDNLLNNACKYSLPGSRVYVSLQQEKNEAVIVFKNISKTALNIPSDELMERFVRGDSSRNTEGSGLGLSIAQSLTELMGGSMKLEIDGDLFKVTLRFPMLMTK